MKKFLIPHTVYAEVARAAFGQQGFPPQDVEGMVRYLVEAKAAGNRSHDLRKMLDLRKKFGNFAGNPNGELHILQNGPVIHRWNCGGVLGPRLIYEALETATASAKLHGMSCVVGLDFSHYGAGFPYGLYAAEQGMIMLLWSTASLAEVVPFGGKRPALGTNAWTLALPVSPGKHFVLDMATSSMAMGVVQSMKVRAAAGEHVELPPNSALDSSGRVTTDPREVAALLPFGGHKGSALSLMSELLCGFVGGGRPSIRCRPEIEHIEGERQSTTFVLQVLDPAQLWCASDDPNQMLANVQTVCGDIFNGNEGGLIAGEPEQHALRQTEQFGNLLFDAADVDVLSEIAEDSGIKHVTRANFTEVEVPLNA